MPNDRVPADVTGLLRAWSSGRAEALDTLVPVVHDELKLIAASYVRRERPEHTLRARGLVSEALLRLVRQHDVTWDDRRNFYGVAAQCVRRIFIDYARQQMAEKSGGDRALVAIDTAADGSESRGIDIIALDDALAALGQLEPRQAQIIELRFFGGLSIAEAASQLGISVATVERDWESARALMHDIRLGHVFDLDKNQWQELKSVLEAAVHASASDRAAVLDRAFAHDPQLLTCARQMLQQCNTATQRFGSVGDGAAAAVVSIDSPSHSGVAIGQTIAHYRVLRKLGEGGMGIVYLAEDERLGRQVALKSLSTTHTAAPADARAQLLAESRAAAVLNHPAIVTLLELVDMGSEMVAVMEYVEGRPLSALIAEPLPLGFALRLAVQLADALAYAHGRGIVHCDLKPANIHILPSGAPKILDFGLARALAGSVDPSDTPGGPLFGTPGYVAPERLLGREPAAAADVYALGVILYRLLTGSAPFHTEDQAQLFLDTVMTVPQRPSLAIAGIPIAVDDVVMRCLAKDPRDRLQPHEIARALSAALLELEPSPHVAPWRSYAPDTEPGLATAATSMGSKNTFALTLAGGVLVCLTVAGFITSVAFNDGLGRVGDFAVESPLLWPYWGMRSTFVVLGSVVLFAVLSLAVTAASEVVAPVRRRLMPTPTWLSSIGRSLTNAPAAALAAPAFIGQLGVISWMVWRFEPTLTSMDSFLTRHDQTLKFLGPAYGAEHTLLSQTLTLQVFVFGITWYWLLSREPRRSRGVRRAYCWAGVALTVISIMFFQVIPFRMLYHAEAERVRFGSERCYVAGRFREDALLFCPQRRPPRTQIIRADEPSLHLEGMFESVFSNIDQ